MIVALGADHAGLALKDVLREHLAGTGHEPLDLGAYELEPTDDYTDVAVVVAEAVAEGRAARGILVCGSGVGMAIAANKIAGVRASVCHDTYSARQGVEHDAMNVLVLGARVIGPALAAELTNTFLAASFSGEPRHVRRLDKIVRLERKGERGDAR